MTETLEQLGPFSSLYSVAVAAITFSAMLYLTWARGTPFTTHDEDFPRGVKRVAGAVGAVLLLTVTAIAEPDHSATLGLAAIAALVVGLGAFFTYLYWWGRLVYTVPGERTVKGKKKPVELKITGGTALLPHVAKELEERKLTVEAYLAGKQYNPVEVWTRESRARAKLGLAVTHFLLIFGISAAIILATIAWDFRHASAGGG